MTQSCPVTDSNPVPGAKNRPRQRSQRGAAVVRHTDVTPRVTNGVAQLVCHTRARLTVAATNDTARGRGRTGRGVSQKGWYIESGWRVAD